MTEKEEFTEEQRSRINPFDWNSKTAGFGEIMNPSRSPLAKGGIKGGFDVVIGNPPYGALFTDNEDAYFSKQFEVFRGVKDVYALFIERGISLLKDKGFLSFIVPSAWTGGPSYLTLRQLILKNKIDKIVMLPFDVFESAYIDTLVFVFLKESKSFKSHVVNTFTYPKKERLSAIDLEAGDYLKVDQKYWLDSEDKKLVLNPNVIDLIKKICGATKFHFGDYIRIKRGVLFDKKLLTTTQKSKQHFEYFEGDIYRYSTNEVLKSWIEFGPALKERPKEFDWFEGRRILLRRLVNRQQRLMASLVEGTYITNKNLYSIKAYKECPLEVILGILNSKLISYLYLHQVSQATKDDFPQVTIADILNLPFPNIELYRNKVQTLHEKVDRMLELHKKKNSLPPSAEREKIEREIVVTDEKIDEIVYGLYGITEEEKKIVETS